MRKRLKVYLRNPVFDMADFKKTLQNVLTCGIPVERNTQPLSFGNREVCEDLFYSAFREVDKTISEVIHLPEYEAIINWMTDTKGKGLILSGSCGRGKTVIISYVIPLLFNHCFGKIVRPIYAEDIPQEINKYKTQWIYCIDDVGVESQVNNYGEKCEGFSTLMSIAEDRIKPVFISTNLDSKKIITRYGVRTLDRIIRLCYPVKFNGESLRK